MANITERQMKSLLRKAQEFQVNDGGRHKVNISTHLTTDKNRLWFCVAAFVGEKVICCDCYEWKDYETNLRAIERFIECVEND